MRYDCTIPGHEENFVELSENWTRGDVKKYIYKAGAEFLDGIRSNTVACCLVGQAGAKTKNPMMLTVDVIQALNYQPGIWWGQVLAAHVNHLHESAQALCLSWRERSEKIDNAERKYICDLPGYEDYFVQINDNWTLGELNSFSVSIGNEFLDLIRPKILTIHLPGIDEPTQLTADNTDKLPYLLWRWLAVALQKAKDDLSRMGEVNARRSLVVSAN